MRRLASISTSTVTPWMASPSPTDRLKRVTSSGTNGTLTCDAPDAAETVPVTAVTSASIRVVSVTSTCPTTV